MLYPPRAHHIKSNPEGKPGPRVHSQTQIQRSKSSNRSFVRTGNTFVASGVESVGVPFLGRVPSYEAVNASIGFGVSGGLADLPCFGRCAKVFVLVFKSID